MVGSLSDTISAPVAQLSLPDLFSKWTYNSDIIVLPSYRSRYAFSDEQMHKVEELLRKLHPADSPSFLVVSRDCWKYKTIQMFGKQLGSHLSRSNASSIVMAQWQSNLFGYPSNLEESPNELLRAARVNNFLMSTVYINGTAYVFLLVSLSWYHCHPKMLSLGKPLSVWCHNFDLCHSIVPVQFVKHRAISLSIEVDSQSVLLTCPCVEF